MVLSSPLSLDAIKLELARPASSLGAERLQLLAESLEPLCDDERIATSPLLDGWWKLLHASSAPRWWGDSTEIYHAIESPQPEWLLDADHPTSAGMPGLLYTFPRAPWRGIGSQWDDCGGRGAYVQRARQPLGERERRAVYSCLGGEEWESQWVSQRRLVLGLPAWRRRLPPADVDADHAIRPTYVDGAHLVLRAPAVASGALELRPPRLYLLRRCRNRLEQASEFSGLTDGWEFER